MIMLEHQAPDDVELRRLAASRKTGPKRAQRPAHAVPRPDELPPDAIGAAQLPKSFPGKEFATCDALPSSRSHFPHWCRRANQQLGYGPVVEGTAALHPEWSDSLRSNERKR